LEKYDGDALSSLTLVDISDGMLDEAVIRVKSLPNLKNIKVTVVKADATSELVALFGDEAFDTVVDSFSLCVMGSLGARQCLDQISTVVKRGEFGQVLLLENSRSSNQPLAMYQDATAGFAAFAGGKGCVYNQNVEAIIEQAHQLSILEQKQYAAGLFRFFKCVRQ
jgi:ubiquinone/menaquinone biosynthesis C-methylase UbiE